jgi:xyloglucan-specific exo-beta-1,4-glucanase
LETWTDVDGDAIIDLMRGTNNFLIAPNATERLGHLLEVESWVGDNYGLRIKGWLVPPVSGSYRFWISSDDNGEFWLSSNDDPANMVIRCYQPYFSQSRDWYNYRYQQSELIALVAGQAYYFKVRACIS